MIHERLVVIEIIPFRNFKEKMRLTKEHNNKNNKVEIIKNCVVVTSTFESNELRKKIGCCKHPKNN